MLQKKETLWTISVFTCIMILFSGNNIAHASSWSTSWLHIKKHNSGWMYTISIQPQDITVSELNGMFTFNLPNCKPLQIPGQPTLLFSTMEQKVTHNADIFIQDIVWSPLIINGERISKHQIQQTTPMYTTNNLTEPLRKCELPGSAVDYIITGNFSNAVCTIRFYPLQIRSGIVHFAKQFSFFLIPRMDETIQSHKEGERKEIIICPDAWESSANKLGLLHAQKGFLSDIVLLSEVQQSTIPLPTKNRSIGLFQDVFQTNKKYIGHLENWNHPLALQIQAFLQNRMTKDPYQYLTLLGDSTLIPASIYASIHRFDFSQVHDFYNEIIPSDFFYMSPNGGGNNLVLESYLGRIPVRTVEECDRYIEKIACWDQNLDIEWFSKKAFVGGDLFHQDYVGELLSQHLIEIMKPSKNLIDKYYLTDGKCNDIEVSRLLQNGHYGFVNICAHGSGSEIRLEPGFIDVRDCMNFKKESALPIVFSYSCMNGAYDTRDSGITYETDPIFGYPTSFGQSLLLSPAGAIAFVGGSRINYSSFFVQTGSQGEIQYNNPQLMDAMCAQFFRSISSSETLGEMCKTTLQEYIRKNVHYDFSLQSFVGFTLLGDPTIQILHPDETNHSSPSKMNVTIDSLVEAKNIYRNDNFFLDSSMPLRIEFTPFSKLLIFNYNSPEKRLFEKDVSHETIEYLESLPSSKICLRLIHTLGYEKRYMIRVSKAKNVIAAFPFTRIKKVYPAERLPYFYQILNTGYQTVDKTTSSFSIKDSSGNTLFTDAREILNLTPLGSYLESFDVTAPSKEGEYTATLLLSWFDGNSQIQYYEDSWHIEVAHHKKHYRIGVPVNARMPVSVIRSIPVEQLNDVHAQSDDWGDETFEFCIFPSSSIQNYSLHGMILFDDDWQDFSEKISISIVEHVSNFSNNGGVVIGFAPNTFHEDVNCLLLRYFGIDSNTFSFTNYSRHLEPLRIIQDENKIFQKDVYFIPSRANWEPFFPFTWQNIALKKANSFLVGISQDQRVGFIQNEKNSFFVSCSFLLLDPTKKTDDVLLFIEDIMTSQAKNNPVSSIVNVE
jgi:hypothetical protein